MTLDKALTYRLGSTDYDTACCHSLLRTLGYITALKCGATTTTEHPKEETLVPTDMEREIKLRMRDGEFYVCNSHDHGHTVYFSLFNGLVRAMKFHHCPGYVNCWQVAPLPVEFEMIRTEILTKSV
jgi:hypothetical protein